MTVVSAAPPAESTVVWWVLLLALVALLLGAALRAPARDALSVVVRRGRVARVAGGWAARLPGVEDVVAWPTGEVRLPVVVRDDTADGVEVRAAVEVAVELPPPQPRTPYADPVRAAERAAEAALADALQARPVTGLLDADDGLTAALHRRGLGAAGELRAVELLELEVLLSPGAGLDASQVGSRVGAGRIGAARGPR